MERYYTRRGKRAVDPETTGVDRFDEQVALAKIGVESRPVWKPMHIQPLFDGAAFTGGSVAHRIFEHGLCLPSGSNLTDEWRAKIIETVRQR